MGLPTYLIDADSERTRNVLSQGLFATNTNDNAPAGGLGEFVTSLIPIGSEVSLSNGVSANMTSIVLTPGDWDVEGNINLDESGCTRTACTAGISQTSATLPVDGSEVQNGQQHTTVTVKDGVELPRKRNSIPPGASVTVYAVVNVAFSAGTCKAYGVLSARRVR